MKTKLKALSVVTGGGLLFPLLVFAQVRDINDIFQIIERLLSWLFALFILAAIFFVLWAAFKYLTSGGDPSKVGEATNRLIFAAVAIAVALLAASVQFIVGDLIGVDPTAPLDIDRPAI
jgi:fumarate reductase subunit D